MTGTLGQNQTFSEMTRTYKSTESESLELGKRNEKAFKKKKNHYSELMPNVKKCNFFLQKNVILNVYFYEYSI